jgi:hypothetical protein
VQQQIAQRKESVTVAVTGRTAVRSVATILVFWGLEVGRKFVTRAKSLGTIRAREAAVFVGIYVHPRRREYEIPLHKHLFSVTVFAELSIHIFQVEARHAHIRFKVLDESRSADETSIAASPRTTVVPG